ncbi:protein TPRXL [Salix suchowensis]|nr:protein TPRXL [Salix suchowensis]
MGCCISKCRAKKRSIDQECHDNNVEDKLVISQAPKTPKIPVPVSNKISPSPPSPTTSISSSGSAFTCANSSTTAISSCSSLSSGSSILSSKDRSFSNEFLWSCVKENPHIIRINSIKERSQLLASPNVYARILDSSAQQAAAPVKQSTPEKANTSTPHKRVRSNSPAALTRQKSFRREPDRFNPSHSLPVSRTLRSPSPSRRFNGDSGRGILTITPKESCSARTVGAKVNPANSFSSSLRKENSRLASPYINSSQPRSSVRNRETCIHRISSKIDEDAVKEALAQQESDSIPMEDIDNPLISLDCFIFL